MATRKMKTLRCFCGAEKIARGSSCCCLGSCACGFTRCWRCGAEVSGNLPLVWISYRDGRPATVVTFDSLIAAENYARGCNYGYAKGNILAATVESRGASY
jgi:hypothetical protein